MTATIASNTTQFGKNTSDHRTTCCIVVIALAAIGTGVGVALCIIHTWQFEPLKVALFVGVPTALFTAAGGSLLYFCIKYRNRIFINKDDQKLIDEMKMEINETPENLTASKPVAIIFSGSCGSGKSTVRKKIIEAATKVHFLVLDPDEIKEKMPSFQELKTKPSYSQWDADDIHSRSLRIRDKLYQHALASQKCMILDNTSANVSFWSENIKQLKQKGYEIGLVRVDVELERAKERCKKRALTEKRIVPEEVIVSSHKASRAAFETLQKRVDWIQTYDNNGEEPTMTNNTCSTTF